MISSRVSLPKAPMVCLPSSCQGVRDVGKAAVVNVHLAEADGQTAFVDVFLQACSALERSAPFIAVPPPECPTPALRIGTTCGHRQACLPARSSMRGR